MDNDKYIGRLLDGRYEILEVIGTGGMAVVYKARCHRLNRLVAIKILKDDYVQDEEFRRRFRAEGEAVGMLSHPNIVSVYDVSSSNQADFIVMELIDGITLKQYMEKRGYLNWKETLHFAIQIAKALEHAHSRGLVHRDIKPHNVMVLKNGSVKVADFGIARVMSKSNTLTKEALGSVHYISPEQAKGGRVDNRSDIYSLGIVMYEMIAGRVPYDGESPVGIAIQHINGGAVKPSRINPGIPDGLENIILKAMALDPADRYPTATAMLYEMDEFRKTPEPVAVPPVVPPAVDGHTRVIPMKPQPPAQPKKTIAERTAVKKDPEAARGAQRPARPRPVGRPQSVDGSRIATVAIISCAAVALIALIIFLIMLGQGWLFNQDDDMVQVPNLLGAYYENLPQYEGLEVYRKNSDYSDTYEKGEIMEQSPPGGDKVVKGTKVFVTVSLGAEAPPKTMNSLIAKDAHEAEKFLLGLNMNLNVVPYEEYSSTVAKGAVTRTEPEAGKELQEGQTVKLWISLGPEVILAKVPGVVGKDYDTACDILNANGFSNVTANWVDSDEEQGTVIGQSVKKNEKIDVTTEIVLDVSNGPDEEVTEPTETEPTETTPPETEPTNPTETQPTEPEEREMDVVFALPPDMFVKYVLTVKKGNEIVHSIEVTPAYGMETMQLPLKGSGMTQFDLYIDGEFWKSEMVDFDPDD